MEKLQSALEKARRQREEQGQPDRPAPATRRPAETAAPARSPRTATGGNDIDERWQALGAFTPEPETLVKNRIVTWDAGPAATQFDILRTKTLLQMRQNGWTRLAITSPTPQCGKTTTACNLALALSRQPDLRTVLFDMDLRRPGVGKYLGLQPEKGIRSLFEGRVDFSEQAMRLRDNLAVSAARHASPDPAELMLSEVTAGILDRIQADYAPDLILFDLPPLLVTDDTRAFLKNVDCALIMARADSTTISQIDACEREVAEHANVLGVVLNECKFAEESHGYDTYY